MRPPVDALERRAGHRDARVRAARVDQERDHQDRDERADEHRFLRHVGAERARPQDAAPDGQEHDAAEDADGERHERHRVGVKAGGAGEIDDAQAAQRLDRRIAGERAEAPEDEEMGDPHDRARGDGPALEDDFADERAEARTELRGLEGPRRPRQQPVAGQHLPHEQRGRGGDEQAEEPDLHGRVASRAATPS